MKYKRKKEGYEYFIEHQKYHPHQLSQKQQQKSAILQFDSIHLPHINNSNNHIYFVLQEFIKIINTIMRTAIKDHNFKKSLVIKFLFDTLLTFHSKAAQLTYIPGDNSISDFYTDFFFIVFLFSVDELREIQSYFLKMIKKKFVITTRNFQFTFNGRNYIIQKTSFFYPILLERGLQNYI